MRAVSSIRTNQVGYLPSAPKRATLVSDAPSPVAFTVRDGGGAPVLTGMSQIPEASPDAASGQHVHVLEFSVVRTAGAYTIEVAGDRSHPFRIDPDVYSTVAADAAQFFTLMRCGAAVVDGVHGRPAGHVGDTAARLVGSQARVDVSGGWYDAGDYGKYVVSGSLPVWHLVRFPDLADECRWQLDWMLRMQIPNGERHAGLAFHRVHGSTWSPMPGLPHDDPTERVVHPPTTAATLHLAATAAHAARHLREDHRYSNRLVAAAIAAWEAAERYPDLLAPDDLGRHGGGPYVDDDLDDDRYWAAAELWITTGERRFGDVLESSPWRHRRAVDLDGYDYDRVAAPARLSLATDAGDGVEHVTAAADDLLALQQRQPWGQAYAPSDGWHWGSNGRMLTNLVVIATAFELTGAARFRDGVASGIDYVMGRNALDRCFVTGHGHRPTTQLRTRMWGHALDPALPPPPPGVLAGGANSKASPGWPPDPRLAGLAPALHYLDEPTSERTNDCCIRWNAPLVRVLRFLHDTEPRGA